MTDRTTKFFLAFDASEVVAIVFHDPREKHIFQVFRGETVEEVEIAIKRFFELTEAKRKKPIQSAPRKETRSDERDEQPGDAPEATAAELLDADPH